MDEYHPSTARTTAHLILKGHPSNKSDEVCNNIHSLIGEPLRMRPATHQACTRRWVSWRGWPLRSCSALSLPCTPQAPATEMDPWLALLTSRQHHSEEQNKKRANIPQSAHIQYTQHIDEATSVQANDGPMRLVPTSPAALIALGPNPSAAADN